MKEELASYGLSDKEIEIYLASLKLGDCTANRLSEITDIRRSTVYEVVETLKKKGLINSYKKDKKFYFIASKPNSLIRRLKEKEDMIKKILPNLEALSNSLPEKPNATIYEGKIGIKNAVEEMLNSKEILIYGAAKMGDKIFGHYTSNFAKRRIEKKIMLKAVIDPDIPKHMIEKDVKKYTKIRTLNFLKNHNSAYFIFENKLLILTLGEELRAMKITSPLLIESQKIIFNFLWKTAKE